MKRFGLREFQRKMYKNLKESPLVLTRDEKPAFLVIPYDEAFAKFLEGETYEEGIVETFQLNEPAPIYGTNTPLVDKEGQPTMTFWQSVKNVLKKKIA